MLWFGGTWSFFSLKLRCPALRNETKSVFCAVYLTGADVIWQRKQSNNINSRIQSVKITPPHLTHWSYGGHHHIRTHLLSHSFFVIIFLSNLIFHRALTHIYNKGADSAEGQSDSQVEWMTFRALFSFFLVFTISFESCYTWHDMHTFTIHFPIPSKMYSNIATSTLLCFTAQSKT